MKGFSLVELIVVLALLGVMASAVAPAIARATTRSPLEQTAASIADTLRAVRRDALRSARFASVVVETASGRFWIAREMATGADSLREGRWLLPPGITLLHMDNRVEMRFGSVGAIRSDSLVVRSDAALRIVAVDRWTGAVTVR